MPPVSVLVAAEGDRRADCRRLLDPAVGIEVVGEVRVGLETPAATGRARPDILVLDFTRARLHALAILPAIRRRAPRTRVLLLVAPRTAERLLLEALHRGARGYVARPAAPTFLARAVRALRAGEAWVPRAMVPRLLDRLVRLSEVPPPARRRPRRARLAAAAGGRRLVPLTATARPPLR